MLERKDMDAVMIATPLNLHAAMVVDSLKAGKHVFVEKTMYFKEEEGEHDPQGHGRQPQVGFAGRACSGGRACSIRWPWK